jgi:hypothetical protein
MYDGETGRYGPKVAMLTMRVGGAATVIIVVSVLTYLYIREHRRKTRAMPAAV